MLRSNTTTIQKLHILMFACNTVNLYALATSEKQTSFRLPPEHACSIPSQPSLFFISLDVEGTICRKSLTIHRDVMRCPRKSHGFGLFPLQIFPFNQPQSETNHLTGSRPGKARKPVGSLFLATKRDKRN